MKRPILAKALVFRGLAAYFQKALLRPVGK